MLRRFEEGCLKNFRDYLKKSGWINGLVLSLSILLASLPSYGGSIREVVQSIERVKSTASPFQFAVLGDSRDGEKVYTQLLQMILERKPDFVIHLGDMISKPPEISKPHEKEWHKFFELSRPINHIPFFPVVGEHDGGTTYLGEEMYREQFLLPEGKTYYAFKAGGALFVVLNSVRGKGIIFDDQWSWLKEMLPSSKGILKMIFLHRPLFPPMDSIKLGDWTGTRSQERDDLHRLFLKTNVKVVFAGHDHRYDRSEKDGILYLITGGGGAPLHALKDRGGFFHYVWVSVDKGKMEGEVVDLEGQIRDRFVIE